MKTPASLNEMIAFAICTCPAGQGIDVAIDHFRQSFKDYMSQGFGAALLDAANKGNFEAEKMIADLWESIIGESVSQKVERRVG